MGFECIVDFDDVFKILLNLYELKSFELCVCSFSALLMAAKRSSGTSKNVKIT